MEARDAKRKKQAQRTTRRKEFIQTVAAEGSTTPTEADYAARRKELVEGCKVPAEVFEEVDERLRSFMDPFLESFTRREQYDHARTYVSGLLSELDQKNAEAVAYLYGQERLGLQRFLGYAEWDDAPLRMKLARQIGETLGEEDGGTRRVISYVWKCCGKKGVCCLIHGSQAMTKWAGCSGFATVYAS